MNQFERNKCRSVPTVFGKPRYQWKDSQNSNTCPMSTTRGQPFTIEQFLNPEKKTSHRPVNRWSTVGSGRQSQQRVIRRPINRPNIEIQQFLNPPKRSSSVSRMPSFYRRGPPMASGFGHQYRTSPGRVISSPRRSYSPPPPGYMRPVSGGTQQYVRPIDPAFQRRQMSSSEYYRARGMSVPPGVTPAFTPAFSRLQISSSQNSFRPIQSPGRYRSPQPSSRSRSSHPNQWYRRRHALVPGGGQ